MTRFVTLTVQVRPHAEQIQVDGRTFTRPEELWAYLHGGASELARKPESLRQSLFISSAAADAWAQAIARGERGPEAGSGISYAKPPGGVAITRVPQGRGLSTERQKIVGKTAEELGL